MPMDLREQKFGIEIELTGLTRKRAAEVIGKYLGQEPHYDGGYYEEYSVRDGQGRKWKVMYDSSIVAVKKGGGSAGDEYKVEFVSPICEYADIPTIQELVRQLRHAGWCCIIILDTSASRIYKKVSGMEVVKWHRKKFMTRNLKFRL